MARERRNVQAQARFLQLLILVNPDHIELKRYERRRFGMRWVRALATRSIQVAVATGLDVDHLFFPIMLNDISQGTHER